MARGKNKLRKGERQAAKFPVPASTSSSASASTGAVTSANGSAASNKNGSGTSSALTGGGRGSLLPDDLALGKHVAHDIEDGHEFDNCDHTNLSLLRMRKVSRSINQLFSASFEVAVPSLFKGMIQNLQDQVLKDKIMSFVEHGLTPEQIKFASSEAATRKGIRSQIRLACEEELGDVVLRLSTEDCFDLLCDLAVRHGRDLKLLGPPCACSFSKCLPCLERLVESVKLDPAMPSRNGSSDANDTKAAGKAAITSSSTTSSVSAEKKSPGWLANINFQPKPIQAKSLHEWIQDLINNDWVDPDDWAGNAWKDTITAAWQNMADTLWTCAREINPNDLPNVKQVHRVLSELNGLDLYYAVVTREIAALKSAANASTAAPFAKDTSAVDKRGKQAGAGSSNALPRTGPNSSEKVTAETWLGGSFHGSEAFSFSLQFENLRRETLKSMMEADKEHEKGVKKAGNKAALAAVKKSTTSTSSASVSHAAALRDCTVRDELGESHRKALARAVREQGNAAYAAGEYFEATEHYTRAIGYDATEAIFPLNRAACLLKLKKFAEAEKDCTAALMLDPANHKAYFRRGVSRAALLKVSAAKADFDKVLSLQDGNAEARDGLKKLSEHFLAEARRREAKSKGGEGAEEEGSALSKSPTKATEASGSTSTLSAAAARAAKAAQAASTQQAKPVMKVSIPADVSVVPHTGTATIEEITGSEEGEEDERETYEDDEEEEEDEIEIYEDDEEEEEDERETYEDDEEEEEEEEGYSGLDEGDGNWTDTDATSSPSAGEGKAQLVHRAEIPAAGEVHQLSSTAANAEAKAGTAPPTMSASSAGSAGRAADGQEEAYLSVDPLAVAQQVAFAFIFGQVVKQRTGVDVPKQMGFMRREELQEDDEEEEDDEDGEEDESNLAGHSIATRYSNWQGKPARTSTAAVTGGRKMAGKLAAVDTRDHQQRKKEAREGPFNLTRSEAVEMVESFFSLHHRKVGAVG